MIETLRHKKAFEYYYLIGDTRALPLVSQKFNVSIITAKRWSAGFNWQKRVEQRDIENTKSLEKKTNKTVVNSKADYRVDIKTQLSVLKAVLNKSIKKIKDNDIVDIENTSDMKDIMMTFEKLCKLDLAIMGENPDDKEIIMVIKTPDEN